jgi:hypothetical protein
MVYDVENFIIDQKTLNDSTFSNIANYTHKEVESRFERLEFTQFDYIIVNPPTWNIILTYFLTIIVSIILSIFVIKNDSKND